MTSFERSGLWWNPSEPDTRWPGTLTFSSADGAELKLMTPRQPANPLLFQLREHDLILGETGTGEHISLLRCLDITVSTLFANAVIVGFHAESADPLIATAAVVLQDIDVWWGPRSVCSDPTVQAPDAVVRYSQPPPLVVIDDIELQVSIRSGLAMSIEGMTCSMAEEIRIEFSAQSPRPLSYFQQRVHACQDLVSIACLSVCRIDELRLRAAGEEGRKRSGTFHATPIFKRPSERPRAWPDLLFRSRDIAAKARDVFSAWLSDAEDLKVVRSLYFSGCYGGGFLELRLLALSQAAEAYHRRRSERSTYLDDSDYEKTVLQPLRAAIPQHLDPSLRASLDKRLEFGNEYSLRRRLKGLFIEHEAALRVVIGPPLMWVDRIVDHRNNFTHHPVTADSLSIEGEELLTARGESR